MQGFDPATERCLRASQVPGAAGTGRHMEYDRSHNRLWFGTDRYTLGPAIPD